MASSDDDKPLTPEDMRLWLRDEVRHVMKAADLQINDATDFVTAYLAGKLSPEQAEERKSRYDERWGERTLEVVMNREATNRQDIADKEILAKLDAQRKHEEKNWGQSMTLRSLPGKHQRGS
jgi:hypothetical protein